MYVGVQYNRADLIIVGRFSNLHRSFVKGKDILTCNCFGFSPTHPPTLPTSCLIMRCPMLAKFKQRSYEAELMDDFSLVGPELDQTLMELRLVNGYLGGLSATLAALAPELQRDPTRSYRILDLGTGSADIPEGIVRWARKQGIHVELIATDINPYTYAYARCCVEDFPEIEVVAADVFHLPFADGAFDYTHAAMFTHHFTQEECAAILKIMYAKATRGMIINDLHRHAFAYYSIKFLTRLFSKSHLVQNDAPLSVLRSFRPADIEELKRKSGIELQYQWRWAFRWLITADVIRPPAPNSGGVVP